MKKNLKNLLILGLVAGSLALTSCRDAEDKADEPAEPMQNEMHEDGMNQDDHDQMDHGDSGEMETYKGDETTAEFRDENTQRSYELYLDIKDALVNTDAETAQTKAEGLTDILDGKEASSAAGEIAQTDNVDAQRESFSDLTAAMEEVLEGAISSGEIYKQFCPMAFEGKGDYWFSNSKDIYNPYFGDKMLKCGRVEATIQ